MKNLKIVIFALLFSATSAQAIEVPKECTLWLQKCEFLRTDNCVQIKVFHEEAERLNKLCLPPYIKRLQSVLREARRDEITASVGVIVNNLILDD